MPKYLLGCYIPQEPPPPGDLQFVTSWVPNATEDVAYSFQLEATGGTLPYTWSLVAPDNTLPAGMSFNSAGLLSGTPTVAGTFSLNFRVTDNLGVFISTGAANFQVAAAGVFTVTTASLSPVTRGNAYNSTLQSVNGVGAVTWSLVAPNNVLPAGLSLVGDTIQGTPTEIGDFSIVVRATDTIPNTADSGLLTLTVNQVADLAIITSPTLTEGEVDSPYSRTLNSSGGWGTKTWAVISGSLPTGISLSTAGVLSGTPTVIQTAIFDISVTDSEARVATQTFSLNIVAEGTVEGPDDYFNEWSVHETVHHVQRLKGLTEPQIQAIQNGKSTPAAPVWVYDPDGDSHPEAQDALKLTVDRFNAGGVRQWSIIGDNQLYIQYPAIHPPDKILYTWDWYWTQEFQTNRGGVYSYKVFQTRPTGGAGWWTHLNRMYSDKIVYFDATRVGRAADLVPAGMLDAGDDRIVPLGEGVEDVPFVPGQGYSQKNYNNSYPFTTSKWLRYWVEVRSAQPPEAFTSWNAKYGVTLGPSLSDIDGLGRWHMLSMWIATEDQDVRRVMYQVPMSWGIARTGLTTSATINSITDTTATQNFPSSYANGTQCVITFGGISYVRFISGVSGKTLTFSENFPDVPPNGSRWAISGSTWLPQVNTFTYEMNTSKVGPVGPMYGYCRDWMAFKNYDLTTVPEDDPIFRRPVR